MSDNLVLEPLRAIRGDIAGLKADVGKLKERVGLLEEQIASISRRLDRVGGDVELIKGRPSIGGHYCESIRVFCG